MIGRVHLLFLVLEISKCW